jgi:hypothetical protein
LSQKPADIQMYAIAFCESQMLGTDSIPECIPAEKVSKRAENIVRTETAEIERSWSKFENSVSITNSIIKLSELEINNGSVNNFVDESESPTGLALSRYNSVDSLPGLPLRHQRTSSTGGAQKPTSMPRDDV